MKKCDQVFLLKIFIILFISPFVVSGQQAQIGVSSIKKIIVDAGHGGPDVGAKGTVTTEAYLTLSVSLKLAQALRDNFPNIKILETRTTSALPGGLTNNVVANRYRADFANRSGADLFISLHCNSAGRRAGGWYEKRVVGREPRTRTVKKGRRRIKQTYYVNIYQDFWVENKVKGTETYIWAVGKVNQKRNSIINNEENYGEVEDSTGTGLNMPDPNDPAERVRMLIYEKKYFDKSYSLASLVEREFVAGGRNSRGVQQRNNKGIWVLQATGMPSILIEMGFISNREEEAYLMSQEGQAEIVNSIVNAVKAYITKHNNVQVSNN